MARDERLALVERAHSEVPVAVQTELLGVSRSSVYYRPSPPRPRRWRSSIASMLNRKAVQRHMREMGIAGIAPGPHTSRPTRDHLVYPYLLRHVTSASPNHV